MVRAAVRGRSPVRSGIRAGSRWERYLAEVEPKLLSNPRLHRFAQVPIRVNTGISPAPIGVWIEADGAEARNMLRESTAPPAAVLDGPLRRALSDTRCRHVALVRSGDVLSPMALERLGQAAAQHPDAAVITCDDDRLDDSGRRHDPRLRPGPSPDRWLAIDDSGPLLLVDRERAAAAMGKLAGGVTWRHELALALATSDNERHAHVPLLLCHRGSGNADPPALDPAVAERFTPGRRVERAGGVRRVRNPISDEASIEVVVCFRDAADLLARCVVSLLSRTSYERFRLTLVDNGSTSSDTATLLASLARRGRVKLLRDDRPFNFGALNNLAARGSSADLLVFLNNDTEIVDPGWLETLLEEALRPEVGAVAPMLLYPDGSVQHAGAAIGLHGYAGHPFAGLMPDGETPFGKAAQGTRNWLAVTAACMMVERTKFAAVGGFDERFVVAGNDVDLCLRLTEAGHRTLCVPHAVVIHDESRSRGTHIDPGDFVRSERSYHDFRTVGDPFYNPSLTLRSTDCGMRLPDEGLQ